MKIPVGLHRYLILADAIIFPAAWLKVISFAAIFCMVSGWAFNQLLGSIFLLIAGAMLFVPAFMLSILYLPYQSLACATSKQFRLVPGIRWRLLVIIFSIILLWTLILTFYLTLKDGSFSSIRLMLVIFGGLSVLVFSIICLSSIHAGAGALALILAPFYVQLVGQYQLQAPLLLAFALIIFVWLLFSHWWFGFSGSISNRNMLGEPLKRFFLPARFPQEPYPFEKLMNHRFLNAKPKTLSGTLLLGVAGGWLPRLVMLSIAILVGIAIWLGFSLWPEKMPGLKTASGAHFIFLMLYLHGHIIATKLYKNAHRTWLHLDGGRMDLSGNIERLYWTKILFWYPQVILLGALYENLSGGLFLGGFSLALLVLVSLAWQTMDFYAKYWDYAKGASAFHRNGLIDLALLTIVVVLGVAISIAWSQDRAIATLMIFGISSILLAIAFSFRWYGHRAWRSVEFLPVKS